MNRSRLVARSTVAPALVLLSLLVPGAAAHWSASGGAAHDHAVILGSETTIGYLGPRICSPDVTSTVLVWSLEHGLCPPGTQPRVPPIRGLLGFGITPICFDLTLSSLTAVKVSSHSGVGFGAETVVNDGDANDQYLSGSTTPLNAAEPAPTAPAGLTRDFGGTGTGVPGAGSTIYPLADQASLRQVTVTGAGSGTQGQYDHLTANDMYDAKTVPGVGVFATPPANRDSSSSHSVVVDTGDNDYETCLGGASFTYAIDSSPNGNGHPGGLYPDTEALTPTPDGCQYPFGDHSCGASLPTPALYCGAGMDRADPGPTGNSLLEIPEVVLGPIGNDGSYDTSASGPGCPGNTAVSSSLIGAGTHVHPTNANTQGIKLASFNSQVQLAYTAVGALDPLRPVRYLVCNDVAATGCTNIPIEDAANTPGSPIEASGHVGARLQLCGYDPVLQTAIQNPSGNPFWAPNAPRYYGEAFDWGGQSKQSLVEPSRPCWPELLRFAPSIGLWAPTSTALPLSWAPDPTPPTARDIESYTLEVQEGDFALLDGWTCGPQTGGPITAGCTPTDVDPIGIGGTGIQPTLWIAGFAAVFV